ncbi:MAG: Rieske 2Fe-2S domain-containing protein [Chlorobi bacterium]|nr:Rieske 2Fe-2S domain-containing protein [Chlorobiota bacterium]
MNKKNEDITEKKENVGSGVPRRSVLEFLLSFSASAVVLSIIYPVVKYLIPPKSREPITNFVKAAKIGDLKPNSGLIFRFGNEPGILIDTPQGELKAFTAVCTHLGCTVQYRPDLRHIWCACHNGHYDLNGINIAGPPPRPLEEYDVLVKGDEIFAQKRQ